MTLDISSTIGSAVVPEEISGRPEMAHESGASGRRSGGELTLVAPCRVFVPELETGRERLVGAIDSGRRKPMFAHYEGHSTGWTLALVHVDGEPSPRWIDAGRVNPTDDDVERWTR